MAAAQGIERKDEAAHQNLEAGLHYAVRTDAPGRPFIDYHTAQTPRARRGRVFSTRGEELRSENLNTVLSVREWRADACFTVALWPRPDHKVDLPGIAGALRQPRFVLYLGRKSAPLGLPLNPEIIEAESFMKAFAARQGTAVDGSLLRRIRIDGMAYGEVAFDHDAPGAPAETRVERPARFGREPLAVAVLRPLGTCRDSETERGLTGMSYLSRVRLRRDASVNALAPLLLGKTGKSSATLQPGHHLIWSLFADDPGRRRDFLWREMERGVYFILSARRPRDRHGLFEIAEPKPFTPMLAADDRLGFTLRANPVVRRRAPGRRRSVKHDIVMDALRNSTGGRARQRLGAVREQGFAWLERQGRQWGFEVAPDCVRIDGYEQHRIPRRGSHRTMAFSTIDFEGILTVRVPETLLAAITRGFGASKAYGCGLMLIRRA